MLSRFDIPVAEIVPEYIVHGLCCIVESILHHCRLNPGGRLVQLVIHPLIHHTELVHLDRNKFSSLKVHKQEPSCVPHLVGKSTTEFERFHVYQEILSLSGHVAESEFHRICAIEIDDLKWIDPIPKRLRHLSSLFITNKTSNIDIGKRHFIEKFE